MTESPKLLPCPWCGSSGLLTGHGACTYVQCSAACPEDLGHTYRTSVEAVEHWNRRAPDPEREAMARVCEAARKFSDHTWCVGDHHALINALADLGRARKGEG